MLQARALLLCGQYLHLGIGLAGSDFPLVPALVLVQPRLLSSRPSPVCCCCCCYCCQARDGGDALLPIHTSGRGHMEVVGN